MVLRRLGRLAGIALVLAALGCRATDPVPPPPSPTSRPVSVLPTPSDPPPTSPLPSPTPQPQLAARVNGQPIYLDDYERQLDRYRIALTDQGVEPDSQEGENLLNQARDQILDGLIERALVEQAAAERGVEVTEADVERHMRELAVEAGGEESLRTKLAGWGETYESAQREVRAQLIGLAMAERVVSAVPQSAEHVRARHILVDTAEEADQLVAELESGADFAALARARSQDSSTGVNGGDLGYLPRGILLVPEVEETVFSLQAGQISGVVESDLGYHIVMVVERDPHRSICSENLQLLHQQAVQAWLEDLWGQAEVERLLGASP